MTGLRALVTGGGSGLGAAIVERLTAAGYVVDLTWRTGSPPACAGRTWQCDFADTDAVAALGETLRREPAYYAFVHNAGVSYDTLVPLLQLDRARRLMEINFWSYVTLAKALIPAMTRRREGRIVAIGSVAAERGSRGNAIYSASKAALHGFTRSLAAELAPRFITANIVAPGFIATPMTDGYGHAGTITDRVPLKRFAQPGEVADCVEFLLRPTSGYITGSLFTIDGGLGSSL